MQIFISFLLLLNSWSYTEPTPKPFVLVELFTSEGCSSCPPADVLLSSIVDENFEDVEVIGMSFHVDYWDYIGWKDPYADQKYTQRQRTYARKFHSNQVYTPQMIVNGKYEFVGSDRSKWNSVFSKANVGEPAYSIRLEKMEVDNHELVIKVSSGSNSRVVLNAAIVERGLSQKVTRGENNGRKLSHDNVVRSFKGRQFDGQENEIRLTVPGDLTISNASLILYVQDEKSWEVIGALKVPLEP
ncbi:MAG: DUF1223 domain-containing protein [Cyclobacteriaceae bacterium]